MLTSYLLQATDHKGLQIQNYRGDWVDCIPIKGTFGNVASPLALPVMMLKHLKLLR